MRVWAAATVLTLAAGTGALLPVSASTATSTFQTHASKVDGIDGHHAGHPGDWVSVGLAVSEDGPKQAATLYLVDAFATIGFACAPDAPGATTTFSVPLSTAPVHFPANWNQSGGWYPTNQWSRHESYQTGVTLPSSLCAGGPVYVAGNGETYQGELESPDNTTGVFHIQLHTAIPAIPDHGSNVNCASASDNPTQPNGQGTPACNFGQNGDVSHLTPSPYVATPAPTSGGSGATGGTPSGGGGSGSTLVPIPVIGAPAGTASRGVPVFSFSPIGGSHGGGPPSTTPTPGAGPSSPSPSSIPPVVFNPITPTGPPQLLTAIGTGWIPAAVVVGVVFVVIMAVLMSSRRRPPERGAS